MTRGGAGMTFLFRHSRGNPDNMKKYRDMCYGPNSRPITRGLAFLVGKEAAVDVVGHTGIERPVAAFQDV